MRLNESQRTISRVPRITRFFPATYGFPDQIKSTVRYFDTFVTTSVLGAVGLYLFRMNSTYDPDYSGTGHQPLYRDTFASCYVNYAVTSSRAVLRAVNERSTAQQVGVVIDDDNTTSSVLSTLVEQSHGQTNLVTPLTGSNSEQAFQVNWNCQTMLGFDPLASDSYKTAVGVNPDKESLLKVWSVDHAAAASADIRWTITLYYDVVWSELVTPTGS